MRIVKQWKSGGNMDSNESVGKYRGETGSVVPGVGICHGHALAARAVL